MRFTKTEYAFDGTPGDFKEVAHYFMCSKLQAAVEETEPPVGEPVQENAPPAPPAPTSKPVLSEAAVKAVFEKRPFTSDQAMVIRLVHQAGDAGITTEDLAKATGFDRKTVKAAIRLLGKRVHHTQAWPKGYEMFRKKWEGSCNRYWIHDVMRAAINAGEVKL